MSIIDEIRARGFKFWNIKHEDTVAFHWDSITPGDYTICFNDKKLEIWTQDFSDEKMATLTLGKIYKILDKKIQSNVSIIDEIRARGFKFWNIKHEDTVAFHWDSITPGDYTICFNDKKLEIWTQDFSDEKMATLTLGKIYKILDKKIQSNVRSSGDKVIQILNDKNQKKWILTDRFAFHPELAQNSMRHELLSGIIDNEIEDPFKTN